MATSRSESYWVIRAQCQDREALELLLRSTQPWLCPYLYRLVGQDHADDVLQEVLILVCRNLKWLHTPELFRPWVYRISNRAALRYLKREKHWQEQVRDESLLEELPASEDASTPNIVYCLLSSRCFRLS